MTMTIKKCVFVVLLLAVLGSQSMLQAAQPPPSPQGLDIYFVDTEGGAATLIVTATGESLLIDSGNPGERDANRIAHVARDVAKLKQIDHYLTTHFHSDHVGGIEPLAKLIPVKRFYDHSVPAPLPRDINPAHIAAYQQASSNNSVVLKPGDEIKLKSARSLPPLRLRILASNGVVLGEPSSAGQIRECGKGHEAKPIDESDNARSLGFVLSFGRFKFFDGGDLTWNVEHKLVCPTNLVGAVDVFQVNHHGLDTSNNPALVEAMQPNIAVINNGPRKGGQVRTFKTLRSTASVKDIFQLHRNVLTTDADNTQPELIANMDEACQAEHVKLSVDRKGQAYMVMVTGKNTSRAYKVR